MKLNLRKMMVTLMVAALCVGTGAVGAFAENENMSKTKSESNYVAVQMYDDDIFTWDEDMLALKKLFTANENSVRIEDEQVPLSASPVTIHTFDDDIFTWDEDMLALKKLFQ